VTVYLEDSIGTPSGKWYNRERYVRLIRSQYMSRSVIFKFYAYIIALAINHTLIYHKESRKVDEVHIRSCAYDLTSKLWPSMSSGCGRPMTARRVGATSPSTPSVFFKLQDSGALAMTKGTLFNVCDVLGVPSSLSISSALLCLSVCSNEWRTS
jgi:hypothetical protein